jgi:hypothetical protein
MVEKNKSIEETLGGFVIACPNCEKSGKKYKTSLYVDWNYGFYSIKCETCGKAVYYDYLGQEVSPQDVHLIINAQGKKEYIN